MEIEPALVKLLGDGRFHSGQAVAQSLGCSRTAVWKHVEALRQRGIDIEATPGRGYRMSEALELLDAEAIRGAMSPDSARVLRDLRVFDVVDSTNDRLLALPTAQRHGVVMLAEHQTAGRGRRGRNWVSPYARNLYLSLGWTFEAGAAELGCLPLIVALAAGKALEESGVRGLAVKWPNDLMLDGRKLGGCLVEIQGDASGPCTAVIGIGINVRMPGSSPEASGIEQPWTDLQNGPATLSRNRLAGRVLCMLLQKIQRFSKHGFEPMRADWERRDLLKGQAVELISAGDSVRGTVVGISDGGALRLQSAAGVAEYTSGEVQVCK